MFFAPVELTDRRRDELVEKAAQAVVRRRLETPAALVLEMHKPISVIGANLVLLGTPLAAPFLGWKFCDELAFFLMDRGNLERLAKRVEELAAERRSPPASEGRGARGDSASPCAAKQTSSAEASEVSEADRRSRQGVAEQGGRGAGDDHVSPPAPRTSPQGETVP
jgi:hypothetical protein